MAFNIEKLVAFSVAAIREFAAKHQDETFYAFAIDASMLCLNSEECARETLKRYQDNWDRRTRPLKSIDEMTTDDQKDEEFGLKMEVKHRGLDRNDRDACLKVINERRDRERARGYEFRTPEGIQWLRDNTGDWEYQGFADLTDANGFDSGLYDDHYSTAMQSEDGHAPETEYAIAMTALVDALLKAEAFDCLKKSPDFKATWVDHDY